MSHNSETETQAKKIAEHLKGGKGLTPLQALDLFGCFRLSARIGELKEIGMKITSSRVKRGKKSVCEYTLIA